MPLRHTLLGLLMVEPMHGYELRKRAGELSWIYPMSNASIYPALHGLEEERFIQHTTEIHRGRARKVYSITHEGKGELQHWLINPSDQKPSYRDPMLLKIVMQNGNSIDTGARAWIESALDEIKAMLADGPDSPETTFESTSPHERLARTYKAKMLQLRAQFLEDVLESMFTNPAHEDPLVEQAGLQALNATRDLK